MYQIQTTVVKPCNKSNSFKYGISSPPPILMVWKRRRKRKGKLEFITKEQNTKKQKKT